MATTQTEHQLSPSASMEREEGEIKTEKVKSRKPPNSAFRQQRLKAWQPILTPKTVLPLLFITGIIFAPIGGLLIYASAQVQELVIDYTDCSTQAPQSTFAPMAADRVTQQFSAAVQPELPMWMHNSTMGRLSNDQRADTFAIDECIIDFVIPQDIRPPIFLYYRLSKFYQNHRRYVKSLLQGQLHGDASSYGTVKDSDCKPLDVDEATQKPIYPCGLIANSLFNDTFASPMQLNPPGGDASLQRFYNMTDQGIAWSSDKQLYGQSQYAPDQCVPPPNWIKKYPFGYSDVDPIPNLNTYEQFQVWMRTAGLPTFSKLALRNDGDVMQAATYRIVIQDFFPVSEYGGTKSIVLSTRTVMGGKNPFLGIAYVIVGGICIVLGAVFLATHLIKPRKLGDHTYLTWNDEQATSTTTTGRASRPGDA